jgi:hypothetical protein
VIQSSAPNKGLHPTPLLASPTPKGTPDAVDKHPLYLDLKSAELPLSSIYLDPNNPRFVTPDSEFVPEHLIDRDDVQEEARRKLIRSFDIEQVRSDIMMNGYLPLDRVAVRQFKPNKYVVLEGNRRICAAKTLEPFMPDGAVTPRAVLRSIVVIPCLLYVGDDPNAAWTLQGIRHLSGVRDWTPYSKARLLVQQMQTEHLTYAELARKFA